MSQSPTARAANLDALDEPIEVDCYTGPNIISTLPSELLSLIFHFHALEELPQLKIGTGSSKLGWIGVTHVCRHWRQVALNDSSLWARITIPEIMPTPKWILEMLVRSRNASLVLHLDSNNPENKDILSKLPPHISHTRRLTLRQLSPFVQASRVVREICALEAPALEHFEVDVAVVQPVRVTFHELGGTMLFKGRAPKLRTISLSQITIPWSLIPPGQLTQLKIDLDSVEREINPDTSPPIDMNQLIDLLINSPGLQVLVFKICPLTMVSQVSYGRSIHLPHLSSLYLGGPTSHVTDLLGMLKFPSSATIRLGCNSKVPSRNDGVILPLISAHFHNPVPTEFKTFRVAVTRFDRQIDVAASIACPKSTSSGYYYSSDVLEDDTDIPVQLTLSFWLAELDILGQVCHMLPISNIEYLSIHHHDEFLVADWYALFQHCKKVTTIHARGDGAINLLQALAPPEDTDATMGMQVEAETNDAADAQGTSTPFPKLTCMLLENLNLGAHMHPSTTLYDIIMNALRQRKMSKMPLKVLCLDRCIITADYVNGLEKHVEEFWWDGDSKSYNEWGDDDHYGWGSLAPADN